MARIGYFEGTDPLVLAKLASEGIETLPVANTWDGHGKYVNHLNKGEVNVVVGYLHKVMPVGQEQTKATDLLYACKNFGTPVVLVVPTSHREKAKKLLGDVGPNVHVTAPEELEGEIRKYV
ncbi:hypothetical protein MUP07_02160 [Candidatus Bathyarchaeota archaeon]|jgi:hypothetical protein|nr:hypothetical protein [Candidatus Bathyarchaeota archaeon]